MAHVDTSVSQRAAASVDYQSGRRIEFARGFRRLLVALFLIFGDSLAILGAVGATGALLAWAGIAAAGQSVAWIALLIPLFFALGLYTRADRSPYQRFRLRLLAAGSYLALTAAAAAPTSKPGWLLLATGCATLSVVLLGHYFEALARGLLIRFDLWGARTAIVGCDEESLKLAKYLTRRPILGFRPVGLIGTLADGETQRSLHALPLIGSLANPAHIPREIEAVIFASEGDIDALAAKSHLLPPSLRLLLMAGVPDSHALWLPAQASSGALGVEFRRNLYLRRNRLFKRSMDIALAIPIALLAAPLIFALAIAIKLIDPGPAFYIQRRVGRNGVVFGMIKLRTMYADAERRLKRHLAENPQASAEWARYFKLKRDPRVLPKLGTLMRRSSLDELPQLWNILRGDMSLVGPRPFPAYHLEGFDAEFRAIRLSVTPGLTGVWQTTSRSDGDLQVQKTEDLFYIRNWSIILDFYLLLQTLPAVLSAQGAR
jgi:Undecaprenyl-phosphate galactose phosphotransferase WbaP